MNILFIVKVILEGLAVAIAAFFIPRKQMKIENVIAIALSAAAIFLLLDQFSPEIGAGARQGAGFGIGLNQVGWGRKEGFEDCKLLCQSNPIKCLNPDHACHRVQPVSFNSIQNGGMDSAAYGKGPCDLQHTIDVGTNVEGKLVKYGTFCTDHYVVDPDKKTSPCLAPHDVKNLTEPYGMRSLPPDFSETNVMGRRMNFIETNCPINSNINEYKVVPGIYSKYALQSGYNENVDAFNAIKREQNANWLTRNPLDLHYLQPVSNFEGKMGDFQSATE